MLRKGHLRSGVRRVSPGACPALGFASARCFASAPVGAALRTSRRPPHHHGSLLTPPSLLAARQMRFQSGSSDPYAILGVKRGATDAEIKSAYKKMALQYHPDRNQSPGAEDKFKEISQAYSLLNDPAKRRQYDQMHGSGGGAGGGGSRAYNYGASGGSHGGQSPFSSGDYARSQGFGNSGFSNVNFDGGRGGGARMSRDDADAMFRNMFGNMEELLRKMDGQQPRGANTGARQSTERVYTTEDGAKHFETIETLANGRTERTTRTQFPDGTVKEKRETMANRQQHEAWENLHQSQPPPNWGGFGGSGPYDQAPGGFKGFGDAMGGGSAGAQPGGFQQQAQQAQAQQSPFGFNRRRSPFGGAAGNPFGVGGSAGNGGGFSNPFESAFRNMGNGGGGGPGGIGGGGGGGQPGSPFGQYGRAGNPFAQGMPLFFSPQRMFLKTLLLVIIVSALLSFFIKHPGIALFVIAVILFLRGGRM